MCDSLIYLQRYFLTLFYFVLSFVIAREEEFQKISKMARDVCLNVTKTLPSIAFESLPTSQMLTFTALE